MLCGSIMPWRVCGLFKLLYKSDAQLIKDAQQRASRSRGSGPLASASGSGAGTPALHNEDKSVKYELHPVLNTWQKYHINGCLFSVTADLVIRRHQTKWSLHQIQGGAVNAAHAHVSCYKRRNPPNHQSDAIHTFRSVMRFRPWTYTVLLVWKGSM